MIKYFHIRLATILFVAAFLSSCLSKNSNKSEIKFSADAQIYQFSATASYDLTKALENTTFAINQIAHPGLIFNRDSLFYGFKPHLAKIKIETRAASGIKIYLSNPDSSYMWNNNDSVAINRLREIEVFSADINSSKKYLFRLNIHQIDPDSIVWKKMVENYLPKSVLAQKTVMQDNRFLTFYVSDNVLRVVSSPTSDGKNWTTHTLSGVPKNFLLSSLCSIDDIIYMTDKQGNIYESVDGLRWIHKPLGKKIKAIYGTLPSNKVDSILTVVEDGGILKFAKTKKFANLRILNAIPEHFPISEFSAVSIKKEKTYNVRFITIAGGKDRDGADTNSTWLLKENEGKIKTASSDRSIHITKQGASLLKYDDKLYLLTTKDGHNVFFISENYGLSWNEVTKKQGLPPEFNHRTHQTTIVDKINNIWIFGGISIDSKNPEQQIDIWKGRLNKLIVNN